MSTPTGAPMLSYLTFLFSQFDFNIEARDCKPQQIPSSDIAKYFGAAQIQMPANSTIHDSHPHVRLDPACPVTSRLKTVAVKSVYKWTFGTTPYVLAFSLRRLWAKADDMANNSDPKVDFEITVHLEHWDKSGHLSQLRGGTDDWGGELQKLFGDEAGASSQSGFDRVGKFLETLYEIGDILEKA